MAENHVVKFTQNDLIENSVPMCTTKLTYNDYRSLLLTFSVLILSSFSAQGQANDWELEMDKDGIQIFSRWLEGDEGQRFREIRAAFEVQAEPQNLVNLVRNPDRALEWMNAAKAFSILATNSPSCWYARTEFNLPWPFQSQDLVAIYKVEESAANATKVSIAAKPDYKPAYPKIERMQHFQASWVFQPSHNGATSVTYRAFTHRKSSAPRWVIDPIIRRSLWKTMRGFRTMAEK